MSKNEIDMEDLQRFIPYDPNAVTYSDIKKIEEKKQQQAFNGLTKEQIEAYAHDPTWVRIRWILFALFWFVWIVMIVAAILIVVFTPKCAYKPKLNFYDNELIYQLDVAKFRDSNNDMKGDLNGLINELDYFDNIGVKTLLLDQSLFNRDALNDLIAKDLGSKEDLKTLKSKMSEKDMHLIIDVSLELFEKKQEIVSDLLKEYADGVRLILSESDSLKPDLNKIFEAISSQIKQIEKETFKSKFFAIYPYEKLHGQTKLIDRSLLSIEKDTVSDAIKFRQKLHSLYTDLNSNPAFLIGDLNESNKKRLSERLNDESLLYLYHSVILLIKGTPVILYGDEIELQKSDTYMKWNNGLNCGFSSFNTSSELENLENCDNNVRKKLARGETLPRIYKRLSQLRQEPSFSWGKIIFPSGSSNLISFLRKANGFEGYLVAANTGTSDSVVDFKSLFNHNQQQAYVEYFYSHDFNYKNDFKLNDSIQLNNVYLKKGELLILKYSN